MSKNKEQHYVQKAYLKLWSKDDNDLVFLHDNFKNKTHPDNHINKILREPKFYDVGDDKSVDKFLSKIEIENFRGLSMIRDGNHNSEIRLQVSKYLAAQISRTKSVKNRFIEVFKVGYAMGLGFLVEGGLISDEIYEKFKEHYFEKMMVEESARNAWLDAIKSEYYYWYREIFNGEWIVISADVNNEFVTSDHPVVLFSRTSTSSSEEFKDVLYREIRFPLSPRKMLLVFLPNVIPSSKPSSIIFSSNLETASSIRECNFFTSMQSNRFLIGTNEEVLSNIAQESVNAWIEFNNNELRAKFALRNKVMNMKSRIDYIDRFKG